MGNAVILAKDTDGIFIIAQGNYDKLAKNIATYRLLAADMRVELFDLTDDEYKKYSEHPELLENDFKDKFQENTY